MKKFILFIPVFMTLFIAMVNANAPTPNIFVGITTDKPIYKSKEPIAIALTILNQASDPYQAVFSNGKTYDFCLYQNDQLIWKWSNGRMFSQAIRNVTLEPNKPLTYVIIYNQITSTGKPLEPGSYNLTGIFCTKDQQYTSASLPIEIRK
jgi:hypothetical protein